MKRTVLTIAATVGLAGGALAQGTVYLDNTSNTSTSPSATSEGILFKQAAQLNQDVNLTLLGGPNAGSLTVIDTIFGASAAGDSFGSGLVADPSGNSFAVPGVALGATGTFELEAWLGNATSYAAASAVVGTYVGISGTFLNSTGGNLVSGIPAIASTLTGLPSFALNPVPAPEPTTMALVGIGAASLLALRRRKA
jgi:hypothetical protein